MMETIRYDDNVIMAIWALAFFAILSTLLFVFVTDCLRWWRRKQGHEETAWLPRGIGNAAAQPLIFVGLILLYGAVYGLLIHVAGTTSEATANARSLVDLEKQLHIFVEAPVQAWVLGSRVLVDAANLVYAFSQFVVVIGVLGWLYLRRNQYFYFVRNSMIIALSISFVVFVFFPVAPPRLYPGGGFVDTITGVVAPSTGVDAYAAVPSLHIAFALILGGALSLLLRRRALKLLALSYPLLLGFAVVATGNHWLLDVAAGMLLALMAFLINAKLIARAHKLWSWPTT